MISHVQGKVELTDITDTDMQTRMKEMKKEDEDEVETPDTVSRNFPRGGDSRHRLTYSSTRWRLPTPSHVLFHAVETPNTVSRTLPRGGDSRHLLTYSSTHRVSHTLKRPVCVKLILLKADHNP